MDDLISRQAAIKEFGCCELTPDGGIDANYAIDFLEQLPSAQQWIPVSERLPEAEKKSYWICTDTGYQCECRWTNVNPLWTKFTTDWHWNTFDIPQYTKVAAWMPLPEPYKEEES